MNKILKLIIDDYHKQGSSAEYRLALHQVCDTERAFMVTLNKKQKTAYMELEFVTGELSLIEQDEFARYLYEVLKKA